MSTVVNMRPGTYRVGACVGAPPDSIWDVLAPKLEHALEVGGPYDIEGLYDLVESCRGLLLVVHDDDGGIYAGIVCEVETWAHRRVLTVVATGGRDFHGWIDGVQEYLEALRDENGCDAIRAVCRPGMGKWLKQIGYRPVAETVEF